MQEVEWGYAVQDAPAAPSEPGQVPPESGAPPSDADGSSLGPSLSVLRGVLDTRSRDLRYMQVQVRSSIPGITPSFVVRSSIHIFRTRFTFFEKIKFRWKEEGGDPKREQFVPKEAQTKPAARN